MINKYIHVQEIIPSNGFFETTINVGVQLRQYFNMTQVDILMTKLEV